MQPAQCQLGCDGAGQGHEHIPLRVPFVALSGEECIGGTRRTLPRAGVVVHRWSRLEAYYYAASGAGLVALTALAWTGAYVP